MKYFLILVFALSLQAQTWPYQADGGALLPNTHLTPGVVDHKLSKEVICNPAWRTGSVRGVSSAAQNRVYHNYGMNDRDSGVCAGIVHVGENRRSITVHCELDHLISLQLGGSNDERNLWPQPYYKPGAYEKDKVEGWLHRQVCSGKIELSDAQAEISHNWYAIYLEMLAAKKESQ